MRSKTGIEDSAFDELYRLHYGRVSAYALRRVGRATAEDVVAETFLIAWRRRQELVGDPLPWLLGVARRVLANQVRASRRSDAVAERATRLAVIPDQAPDESSALVDAPIGLALASLRARDQEALVLTAWDGLSPAQAARVLGCSAATFRVRLHRAKKRLVQALAEAESDESPVLERTSIAATEAKG